MADDRYFHIVAEPPLQVVSVGAKITYSLIPNPKKVTRSKAPLCVWLCVNDASSGGEAVFGALSKPQWEGASWAIPGHHKVIARADTEDGINAYYEHIQIVEPISKFVRPPPPLPKDPDDPVVICDGVSRKIALMAEMAKLQPPPEEKKAEFERHMNSLEHYHQGLQKRLQEVRYESDLPLYLFRRVVRAEHFSAETQERSVLRVFLVQRPFGRGWTLVDWTNPVTDETSGGFYGSGDNDEQAIRAAFGEWAHRNRYPPGFIVWAVEISLLTMPQNGQPGTWETKVFEGKFDTTGKTFLDRISDFFAIVAFGAAVVAGVITLFAPVPGSQVVSALIWASILSGTASSAINIHQRAKEGVSDFKRDAFDYLNILANVCGGTGAIAGAIWKRGAQVTLEATVASGARKVMITAFIGQAGADGIQGVFIGIDQAKEIKRILADSSLTPEERVDELVKTLGLAAANAILLYVNIKGTKADIAALGKEPKDPGALSAEKKLAKLGKEDEKIDLTAADKPKHKNEGHTADGTHETTAQLDHEKDEPALPKYHVKPKTLREKLDSAMGPTQSKKHWEWLASEGRQKPQLAHLTDEELVAIRGYTSDDLNPDFTHYVPDKRGNTTRRDYQRLNKALKNRDTAELATLQPYIDLVTSGLKKLPEHKGDVFRVLDEADRQRTLREFVPGKIRPEAGFTSTSYGKPLKKMPVTIIVKNTQGGRYVEDISVYNELEREVLFPPGVATSLVLKVTEYEPEHFLIIMEQQ